MWLVFAKIIRTIRFPCAQLCKNIIIIKIISIVYVTMKAGDRIAELMRIMTNIHK